MNDLGAPIKDQGLLYRVIYSALLLGLLGALGNFFPLSLGQYINLHFGNVAYLVAASLFRPWGTLGVAGLSLLPMVWAELPPWLVLVYLLESLWVSVWRTRGMAVLFSSAVFWVVIILPLLVVLQSGQMQGQFWLESLNLMLNGLLMASIAQLISDGLQMSNVSKDIVQHAPTRESIKFVLLRVLSAFAVLLSLGLGLTLNQTFEQRQSADQQQHMLREAEILASMLEEYANVHVAIVSSVAEEMAGLPKEDAQRLLTNVKSSRPGFITMLVADERGQIIHTAPENLLDDSEDAPMSVIDRDYFTEAIKQRRPYISQPFFGRGFGRDVIVAISAPIVSKRGDIEGVVEGSLNLKRIGLFHGFNLSAEHNKVVITDARNRVIFANNGLGLNPLDAFSLSNVGKQELFVDSHGTRYSAAVTGLSMGWNIFVLHPETLVLANILEHFSSLFVTLGFITLVAIVLSARLAVSLSSPLLRLVQDIRGEPGQETPTQIIDVEEIHQLYDTYYNNKRRIEYQQQHLEERVYRRTMDLLEANNELSRQSYSDSLTGLDNQRSMAERFAQLRSLAQRNDGRLIVLSIDIDYLKRVNETYGHDKGDRCIVGMAEVLQSCFQREYDIVARLGSDQFVVITQVFDWDVLRQYIDVCRLKIESTSIHIDKDREVSLTVSMGGFVAPAEWSQYYEDWLQLADKLMHQAKSHGRNKLATDVHSLNNPIPVPSLSLLDRDMEQHQAMFIEPLHSGQLQWRFENLRSNLSRSGGALLVVKFAAPNDSYDHGGLKRESCRDLLQVFRRGYDTVAMIDEKACIVVTAVATREEAESLIERALYRLIKQQPSLVDDLLAGAVMAEATWQSDFNEWLGQCDAKINDVAPDSRRRYHLLCLAGKLV